MKPLTKLYLKAFLVMGIGFGASLFLFDLIFVDAIHGWKYVFQGLFFGLIMSWMMVTYHKNRLRELGADELTEDVLKVSQKRRLNSSLDKQELKDLFKNDLLLGQMKMKESVDGIILRSGISTDSWGEIIKISASPSANDEFEYEITSSPRFSPTLVDFGRNFQNVTRIEWLLKKAV